MNNADFQRLLLTNDKELVTNLTKAPKKKGKARPGPEKRRREKGAGKGAGAGGAAGGQTGKAGGKGGEPAGPKEGQDYRDRAKERREVKGEYERVAEEWEHHGEVSVEQSKYLGGDLSHTHLVKGLDYALLSKVRTELTKQRKAEEVQQQRVQRKVQKKQSFQSVLARRIWHSLVETLHPHHATFKERLSKMGKAISLGQRIRGAPSTFLPGRTAYEFDTAMSQGNTDIPRIVYMSKEDAPAVDGSRHVASVLPETVAKVRDALSRATEERRQRKRERVAGVEASSYVATQKVVARHRAKDAGDDIFAGAGGFDVAAVVKEAEAKKASRASPRASQAPAKASYFDDAGAAKYRTAPDGQLEPDSIHVEERGGGGGGSGGAETAEEADGRFQPAQRWLGRKKGWVFKLGAQGLGYYPDKISAQAASQQARASQRTAASRTRSHRAPGDEDAYGECFPESGLGQALVATGEGESDAEEAEDASSRLKKLAKLAKKDQAPDSVAANKKGEAKKRKLSEAQEWQKIGHMIKKGNHKSIEELEAAAGRQHRRQPPAPRELNMTPAYF